MSKARELLERAQESNLSEAKDSATADELAQLIEDTELTVDDLTELGKKQPKGPNRKAIEKLASGLERWQQEATKVADKLFQ